MLSEKSKLFAPNKNVICTLSWMIMISWVAYRGVQPTKHAVNDNNLL